MADARFKKNNKIHLTKSSPQDQVKNAMLGAVLLILLIWLIWKRIIAHQMNKSFRWKKAFLCFAYVKITKPHNTVIYPGSLAMLCTNHLFWSAFSSRLYQKQTQQNSHNKLCGVFVWRATYQSNGNVKIKNKNKKMIRCIRSLSVKELKMPSSSRYSCLTHGKVRAVCDLHAAGCDMEGLNQSCHDLLIVSVVLPLANFWTGHDRILRISSSGYWLKHSSASLLG